ncbi:MAG: EamA family transporter [Magnetococcus sp. MYC-9]
MRAQPLSSLLVAALLLAILLDTAAQLLWKWAVAGLPDAADPWLLLRAVVGQPLFLIVAALFLLQLFNWLKVLDHADLSFAQPITSLSYVTVTGLSMLLFDEPLGLLKMAGILCILVGVWIISQGQPLTLPGTPESPP